MKKERLEKVTMKDYIGIYDPSKRIRLKNLYPKKTIEVKVPATAFIEGYNIIRTTDLHYKLRKRRTFSFAEYKKLSKLYGEKPK